MPSSAAAAANGAGIRTPVRRSLIAATFVVALVTMAAFVAGAYAFVYLPISGGLAVAKLTDISQQVEERIRTVVSRVEAVARLSRAWGRLGMIDIDRVAHFNALMGPIVENGPNLSAVVLAEESGHELLLLHVGGGQWLNRLTHPDAWGNKARYLTWNQWELQSDETRAFDYDARTRPWFRGAMAQQDENAIFWTDPFIFRSTQGPGVSAVVRWTAPDGRRYVATHDIELINLSRYTAAIVAGRSGFAAVISGDGKMIALPHDARFLTDAGINSAILHPVQEVGVPALAEGYQRWQKSGAAPGELTQYWVGGTRWVCAFRPITLGTHAFWVGTFAPQEELAPSWSNYVWLILALMAASLLLAWLIATRVAHRFTAPLHRLVDESARIGRLDLKDPVDVHAPWREIDELARAQESMRRELLAATAHLEDARESLEAKVEERTRELALARDVAEAASSAKADFLAKMSHEIRTPLNAVIGLSHLAQRHGVERSPRYLERIHSCARHLLDVVNDILDFSKMEAGKFAVEDVEFSLKDMMEHVAGLVAGKAEAKGLHLCVHIADGVPDAVVGDPLRTGQILINLVNNAVKFTERGEVTLRVLVVSQDAQQACLRFEVEDTGIGISRQDLAKLFQPFQQADDSTTRRFEGTGLGLAICRHLAGLMHGEVSVESVPGEGSTFALQVTLRRGTGAAPDSLSGGLAPETTGADGWNPLPTHELQGAHILLVEDNQDNREVAIELLEEARITVSLAHDGAEAVHRVEQQPFDLILMDLQMPLMDGFEATRRIRTLPHGGNLPIIAMTASVMPGDRDRCAAAGMTAQLVKPVEPELLYATLRRWLRRSVVKPSPPAGPHAAPAADLPAVQGLDVALGLRRLLGKRDTYLKVLRRFHGERSDAAARIHDALARGDREEARSIVHGMTSLAGTMGAALLHEKAAELELALHEERPWSAALDQFAREMDALVRALESSGILKYQE